jgi:hypothetical protein
MKKDFSKEDALLTKWKPFLPVWKITHRKSKKRTFMLLTAQLLDNQERHMKNLPPGQYLLQSSLLEAMLPKWSFK